MFLIRFMSSCQISPRSEIPCARSAAPRKYGMKLSTWVQFAWNLAALPKTVPPIDARYSVEAASPEDRPLLSAAITRSLSMEPAWSDDLGARVKLAEELIEVAFPAGEVFFIDIGANRISRIGTDGVVSTVVAEAIQLRREKGDDHALAEAGAEADPDVGL